MVFHLLQPRDQPRRCSIVYVMLVSMKIQVLASQNSCSSNSDQAWSQEEREALTDLFMVFYEIDQQTNVVKVCSDEESDQ